MQNAYARKLNDVHTALKCDDVSHLWRQRGNDKFRANCVKESYRCYCKSVLYATQEGPMYPLALANRSAALLRLKKYKVILTWQIYNIHNVCSQENSILLLFLTFIDYIGNYNLVI